MRFKIITLLSLISLVCVLPLSSRSVSPLYPKIFWGRDAERGAVVVSTKEILVIGVNGEKIEKVATGEHAYGVYVSPDGKKVAYTTVKGLWLAKLDTKENYLVSEGNCGDLHWNKDSLSFLFLLSKEENSNFTLKLLWADGDGKNIKQVYP